jgi:hypothetical protein
MMEQVLPRVLMMVVIITKGSYELDLFVNKPRHHVKDHRHHKEKNKQTSMIKNVVAKHIKLVIVES